jgi:hypothetical protein
MSKVVQLKEYQNRELVETLEDILELARAGRIKGHCFVVKLDDDDHRAGYTGDYKRTPAEALRATFLLERHLMDPLPTRLIETRY